MNLEKSSPFFVMPNRTGQIDTIHIMDKLAQLGVKIDGVNLGNFDAIGEFTAKKQRQPNTDLYKQVGAFFRPNYERGILIYYLIKHFNISSMLEIGYGRGYSCMCAAMAFNEIGRGKITTVDPNLDQNQVNYLSQIFPKQWFDHIEFVQTTSDQYFSQTDENFDLVYVDGDHRYQAVYNDWMNSKDRFNKLLLFDDYHMPTKQDRDVDCANVIDSISGFNKQLIIMDRRIFQDDRGLKDDQIDYGQVLIWR